MKIKFILMCVFFVAAFVLASCKEDSNEPQEEQLLKERLIGEWIWIYPDGSIWDTSYIVTFSRDTISTLQHNKKIMSYAYKALNADTIQVRRVGLGQEYETFDCPEITEHKVVFCGPNTFESDTHNIHHIEHKICTPDLLILYYFFPTISQAQYPSNYATLLLYRKNGGVK